MSQRYYIESDIAHVSPVIYGASRGEGSPLGNCVRGISDPPWIDDMLCTPSSKLSACRLRDPSWLI